MGAEVAMVDGPGVVDVAALARDAVARGADLLGVAGGDGTQALVAGIAAEHDLPFLVISAGTRNHFALDLGLDRDDPSTCLAGLTDGVELRIDLGMIGGRTFVNNASFGAYAEIVQSPEYRDDKARTTLNMLPDQLAGHRGARLSVRVGDVRIDGPQAVLVSNDPYGSTDLAGLGRRARLDRGVLGMVAISVANARQAVGLLRRSHQHGLQQVRRGRGGRRRRQRRDPGRDRRRGHPDAHAGAVHHGARRRCGCGSRRTVPAFRRRSRPSTGSGCGGWPSPVAAASQRDDHPVVRVMAAATSSRDSERPGSRGTAPSREAGQWPTWRSRGRSGSRGKQAGERLIAVGKALAGGADVGAGLRRGFDQLHRRGPLEWEFELEVDGDEIELEIELKWSDAAPAAPAAPAARATPAKSAPAAKRARSPRVRPMETNPR